jgi:hypothetical protein
MALASGVATRLAYKKETTWGTAAGAASAQILRRVSTDLDLSKETFQSGEISSTYQITDYRHGARKVQGGIKGELSPATYKEFFQSALRRDFAAVTAISGLGITVAVAALVNNVQTYTVTRAAGDFLAGGIKTGHVVRLSVGTFNAANLNKNLFVISLTATVLTVVPLNGVALFAEGPIATSTVTVVGKTTYTPTTAQTNDSYTIERWFSDVSRSSMFTGCRVAGFDIGLTPQGMASIDFSFLGKDKVDTGAAYFTAPTAQTSTGVLAPVNGMLRIGGAFVATVTNLSVKVDNGMSTSAVVGSNVTPDVFVGRVNVTGSFTAMFESGTFTDAFLNESEIALAAVFATGTAGTADFLAITLPRIKLGSASIDDGEKGLSVTCSFQALYNSAGGAAVDSEQTTLVLQDSAA